MRITGGWVVAVLLLATGCAVSPPPVTPVSTPASSPAGSPSSSPAGSPVSTPANPSASATSVAPDPSGALSEPMPPSDGGPMLWPSQHAVWSEWYGDTELTYGFVDASGVEVVEPRYDWYEYCHDTAGRASFVIGASGRPEIDLLGLDGELLASVTADSATCGPVGYVVFTHEIEPELGQYRDGLLEVATDTVVLAQAPGQHLAVVDDATVNVSTRSGEYFLDPATGVRTPHQGWVYWAELEAGAPALPAVSSRRALRTGDGSFGYIARTGEWVVEPTLSDAAAFANGFAVVSDGEASTFLNAEFDRVGGEWDSIDTVWNSADDTTIGYAVTRAGQQGLLGPDLRVILEPSAGSVDCDWQALGACRVRAADGSTSAVELPSGEPITVPDGFQQVFSPSFLGDLRSADDDEWVASKVYLVAAGRSVDLGGWYACQAEGAWLVCSGRGGMQAPVVLDAAGNRASYRSVAGVADPVPGVGDTYYWVVAGGYQGFVDPDGAWRFRESRYNRLQD